MTGGASALFSSPSLEGEGRPRSRKLNERVGEGDAARAEQAAPPTRPLPAMRSARRGGELRRSVIRNDVSSVHTDLSVRQNLTAERTQPEAAEPHAAALFLRSHFPISRAGNQFLSAESTFTPPRTAEGSPVRLTGPRFVRGVFVQSSCTGTDQRRGARCAEAANRRYRGVALLKPDDAKDESARLDAAGYAAGAFISCSIRQTRRS